MADSDQIRDFPVCYYDKHFVTSSSDNQNRKRKMFITSNISGLKLRVCNEDLISYFSTKTYVVGTQKNCLNETILLSTQNICKKL